MPSPNAILARASISRPSATIIASYPWRMLARCACTAPRCLPMPIVIILKSPDSTVPVKPVWGFTRLMTPIQSASAAWASSHTGNPRAVPICTTSIVARIGQPMADSVMP